MQEFKLPDLGEGMQEAEVVEWLVKQGDMLKLDQTMVKVETDKAVVEIPSPIAGRVTEIRVQDGQVAKVGDVLIVFENATSTHGGSSTLPQSFTPAPATSQSASAHTPTPLAQTPTTNRRVLAAPAVRKLAFELGIDLEQVTPSNPNGRVSIEDVRAYAERAKAAPPAPPPAPTQEEQPAPQPPPVTEQKAERAVPTRQDERKP